MPMPEEHDAMRCPEAPHEKPFGVMQTWPVKAPSKKNQDEEMAAELIRRFEESGLFCSADGVRLLLAHLHPFGCCGHLTSERKEIAETLLEVCLEDGRLGLAEGIQAFIIELSRPKVGRESTHTFATGETFDEKH